MRLVLAGWNSSLNGLKMVIIRADSLLSETGIVLDLMTPWLFPVLV